MAWPSVYMDTPQSSPEFGFVRSDSPLVVENCNNVYNTVYVSWKPSRTLQKAMERGNKSQLNRLHEIFKITCAQIMLLASTSKFICIFAMNSYLYAISINFPGKSYQTISRRGEFPLIRSNCGPSCRPRPIWSPKRVGHQSVGGKFGASWGRGSESLSGLPMDTYRYRRIPMGTYGYLWFKLDV